MGFAANSSVPVGRTQDEIKKTLTKYGATGFMFGHSQTAALVMFEINFRRVKFVLPVPKDTETREDAQLERTRWRCLLLAIKWWEWVFFTIFTMPAVLCIICSDEGKAAILLALVIVIFLLGFGSCAHIIAVATGGP